ncbi:N/A [soil metagenome]
MANKVALRELQSRLAERLKEARTQDRAQSWLAVEAGGHALLFPLQEAGEIFPIGPMLPVPHTFTWFLGVANLRGGLHGVIDLGRFLRSGGTTRPDGAQPFDGNGSGQGSASEAENAPDAGREQARLVALNPALECNAALLVDRLAGLRNLSQLTPEASDSRPRPAFAGDRFRDGGGKLWQEVRLSALASDPAFLKIVG